MLNRLKLDVALLVIVSFLEFSSYNRRIEINRYCKQIILMKNVFVLLQGVIFSIAFHKRKHLVCSVSDDRSICIWQVKGQGHAAEVTLDQWDVSDWKGAEFGILHSLYGHTARVWDVRLLDTGLVSIGEVGSFIICPE